MPAPVGSPLHYQPRTVLICCMRLIGDVILTTPLIGILKEAYPDISIDFLVNRKTGEFLEKDSRVRKVIYSETFDIDQNKHIGGRSYFKQIFRKYDLSINTNYADRGNISAVPRDQSIILDAALIIGVRAHARRLRLLGTRYPRDPYAGEPPRQGWRATLAADTRGRCSEAM